MATRMKLGVSLRGLPRPSDSWVWHYTDAAALVSIVRDGVIFASAPSSLNDASEVSYGLELIADVWNKRKDSLPRERGIDVMDEILTHDIANELRDAVFVLSACESGDLLNQWQHYARGGGYAIAIDTSGPLSMLKVNAGTGAGNPRRLLLPKWRRVIYSRDAQRRSAWSALSQATDDLAGTAEAELPMAQRQVKRLVATLVCHFKDPAFEPEQEHRYVVSLNRGDKVERFRVSRSGSVAPYVQLTGLSDSMGLELRAVDEAAPLPIVAVNVGPTYDRDAKANLVRMMRHYGYDSAVVDHSRVPLH